MIESKSTVRTLHTIQEMWAILVGDNVYNFKFVYAIE